MSTFVYIKGSSNSGTVAASFQAPEICSSNPTIFTCIVNRSVVHVIKQ